MAEEFVKLATSPPWGNKGSFSSWHGKSDVWKVSPVVKPCRMADFRFPAKEGQKVKWPLPSENDKDNFSNHLASANNKLLLAENVLHILRKRVAGLFLFCSVKVLQALLPLLRIFANKSWAVK
ncbi:hypothetical protein NPIL_472611 [Nephila pilipes]|uniref:Uncharacterized protein n=1 Tax=Nephila pilipes TaxID=299642 RepID=A0A8X6Q518_NEPPI|nr:hypothetical protein NPIL_472611 [Nephila pilipes]